MIFVPLWISLSYTVGAYSLFGGGFLATYGVIDYSGGYVIHLASGVTGFVGAAWIGPRLDADRINFKPNNILLVMLGAGILWTGWNGFNGRDPYSASPDAGAAVLNTNICTAASLLTWMVCDMIYCKKPSILGAVNGMITGLVAITPAAGVIAGWSAIVMGVLSGSIPWFSYNIMSKLRLFRLVDDVLGVYHTHFVAGLIGGLFNGVFATAEGCAAFGLTNNGGAIQGNWKQVYIQLNGGLFIIALNIVIMSIIMMFIKFVCRVPLRMSEAHLLIGDDIAHGEDAYCFGEPTPHLFGSHDRKHSGDLRVTATGCARKRFRAKNHHHQVVLQLMAHLRSSSWSPVFQSMTSHATLKTTTLFHSCSYSISTLFFFFL